MHRAQILQLVVHHLQGQFPKACACCGAVYPDLASYVRGTRHLGEPMAYDADERNFRPEHPLGAAAFSNCACGTTLVLTSEGMDREALWELLAWLQGEMRRRDLDASAILTELRGEIDAALLGKRAELRRDSTPA